MWRPAAGVPDSAVSIGPRLRALAVYLLVFQHLPVERCRQLLSDVAGAEVSAGFIHSCLATAASMAAGTVRLIKTLLIAAKVVGFDETTLRSGAAGEKKYVHGAFTERYSLFHLGTRSLETMKDFGILPDFAGIAVTGRTDRYRRETRGLLSVTGFPPASVLGWQSSPLPTGHVAGTGSGLSISVAAVALTGNRVTRGCARAVLCLTW